ncbi:MAG: PPC domain-containing protein [Myxococcales bacterium]|nr:PPC domain-containing protein [Myxococcales bacterium]MCB9523258.1 PPC domain-containing protein [Myxococcales bacterium]
MSALTIGVWACDDDPAPQGGDMMPGGQGGQGGQGGGGAGGEGGMGGTGGEDPGRVCSFDADCPNGQYCDIEPNAFEGRCLIGCRTNPDSCTDGQICNPQTHNCEVPGCAGDDARCAEDEFCGENDQCVTGCRTNPDNCPLAADGRSQTCVASGDTRTCETVYPCCNGATCSESTRAACEGGGGSVLEGPLTCEENPCDNTRCQGDGDCAQGEYCGPDGLCIEGCQVGEQCPNPDLACDAQSRTCVEVQCDSNDQCAEAFQFCDTQLNLCRFGCRSDENCEAGLSCVQGRCLSICDPNDANACGDGAYCDPNIRECRDDCESNEACNEDEACNFDNNQCERGRCRDDANEPNDDVASATGIELGAADANGIRRGAADGLILCDDDVNEGETAAQDFYAVQLAQGERLRVELVNPGVGDANLDLELLGDEVDDPQVAASLEEVEAIEYPALNVVKPATTYYIRVYGEIDEPTEYSIRVTVVPAENACFPDGREPDDNADQATRIAGDQARYVGTICANDEDWFTLPLALDDGITITVTTPRDSGDLRVRLYSDTGLSGPGGLVNPAFDAGAGQDVGGRINYRIQVPENTNGLSDDNYFLRIDADNPADLAAYDLNVVVVRVNDPCLPDAHEDNDTLADGIQLDNVAGISQGGQVIENQDHEVFDDAGICPGDVDYYCLTAEGGDILEAWIVADPALVLGEIEVQWVDEEDGAVGGRARISAPGGAPVKARAPGVAAGIYCARVDGLAQAEGPYTLFVRRSVLENPDLCPQDAAETAPGARRNDRADDSVALDDVSDGQGLRFQYDQGLLCDVNNTRDQDWYTFDVGEAESRVCVTVEGFENSRANVDMQVFRVAAAGDPCQNDDQCGALGACIQGQCRAITDRSTTGFDAEMVNLTPGVVGNRIGEHFVRVFRGAAGELASYTVTATVTPPGDCVPDWQEVDEANNSFDNGTPLGSGEVAMCDAWICRAEAAQGDWYDIAVPAGEDRTVFIEYQQAVDGNLQLFFSGPLADLNGMAGFGASRTVGNYLCMNIEGGAEDQVVTFGLQGQPIPGRNRIDYNVRVVPTDLEASDVGDCYTLGAIELPACEPVANNFYMGCFPTFTLP